MAGVMAAERMAEINTGKVMAERSTAWRAMAVAGKMKRSTAVSTMKGRVVAREMPPDTIVNTEKLNAYV
jgi:hypothetical protein